MSARSVAAGPSTMDECEDLYLPESVRPGKDVVWMPTPDYLVDGMLRLAQVVADDYLIDLGAGDGRIPIAAARDFGATALGIEYDRDFVRLARCMVEVEDVGDRVRIVEGDIFVADFSHATVLTLFLLPELNLCIRHRVLAMRPGTRVVSHHFDMQEWRADDQVIVNERIGYLWVVPARVGGRWDFRDAAGSLVLSVDLRQHFQEVAGDVYLDGAATPLHQATLHGDALEIRFDHSGKQASLHGLVSGEVITGEIMHASAAALAVTGTLSGGFAPATWADMAAGCEQFYAR